MEQFSRKPALARMRQIAEARLAPLLSINSTAPLTPQQREAVKNVIDDVRALFRCLDDMDNEYQKLCDQSLPGRTLYEVFIKHPDSDPADIWNAFVESEAEHCASIETPPEEPVVPIDPWKARKKRQQR
jgi:hypothetical protein